MDRKIKWKQIWRDDKEMCKKPIIVIYKHPKEHPDRYVARLFDDALPIPMVSIEDTLEELETWLPLEGMVWIERHANDDPVILGTWV